MPSEPISSASQSSPKARIAIGDRSPSTLTARNERPNLSKTSNLIVICADAWTNRLLEPLGHTVSMAVTREQVSYFPTADLDDLRPGRFPVWIWMHDPSYYGFPVYGPADVGDCIKGAEDCGGAAVDPDTRTFEPDSTMERRLGDFMRDLVGDRFGAPRSTTCLYMLTADRDLQLFTTTTSPFTKNGHRHLLREQQFSPSTGTGQAIQQ